MVGQIGSICSDAGIALDMHSEEGAETVKPLIYLSNQVQAFT